MTHINHINEPTQSFPPGAKAEKNHKTDAFESALIKALDGKEASEMESSSTIPLKEITAAGPTFKSHSEIVSGKTDRLLDMLDTYSSKLEDPAIPLKNIAPVLDQIHANAGSLKQEAQSLSDSDSALKQIADQTVATAQAEYLKFQRGDYSS